MLEIATVRTYRYMRTTTNMSYKPRRGVMDIMSFPGVLTTISSLMAIEH